MTSKLKCPFCGEELEPTYGYGVGLYSCPNLTCKGPHGYAEDSVWQALTQAKQDLKQSERCCSAWETQAVDYKAETIALSGKLEIAQKALEEIKKHNKAIRSVLGEQIPEKSTDIEEYCWWASCRIQDCLNNALKQITHDNSEKANNQEHKE